MTSLHKSPENLSSHSPKPVPLAEKISRMLPVVDLEVARIKKSIEPFSKDDLDLKSLGNGYYLITPNAAGKKHIEEVGFDAFSRAVEYAILEQKWGIIVDEILPKTQSIRIFVSRASQRQ